MISSISCDRTGLSPTQEVRILSVSRFGQMYVQETGRESIEVNELSGRRFLECLSSVVPSDVKPNVPAHVKVLYQSSGEPIELSLYQLKNGLLLTQGKNSFFFSDGNSKASVKQWLLDIRGTK